MSKSYGLLKARQIEIEQEIDRLAELHSLVKRKARALAAALDTHFPFGEVRRCELPRRRVLASSLMTPSLVDLNQEFIKLAQRLGEAAPVVATDRIGISFEENDAGDVQMRAGMVLEEFLGGDEGMFEELDASEYLCMYRFGNPLDIEESWGIIRRYAADAGLRLASELIEIFVVDQSVTDDPRENIFDVQVRILPCNEDCLS